MKVKIVWIEARNYTENGKMIGVPGYNNVEVSYTEPEYDIELYDKFILIPLEED